jgi:hypothetical protein
VTGGFLVTRVPLKRVLLFLGVLVSSSLISAAIASATASSGMVYDSTLGYQTYLAAYPCREAVIADVADNKGYARTATSTTCGTGKVVSAGFLGVHISAFRDGSFCTFAEQTSASATDTYGLGGHLCSDPAGLQAFYTYAYGLFWNGGGYNYGSNQLSPTQYY